MILFCLPYAGGAESAYYKWKKYFKKGIELNSVKLKGRGTRIGQGFYKNMEEAVDDIFNNIKDIIKSEDYAIYGHSMGSMLAYELYYKIEKENLRKPKHMFFSGQVAPGKRVLRKISSLPDDLFIDEIVQLGGTPQEVLDCEELLKIVIPILRNDFRMIEESDYEKKPEKMSCDITVFNGLQDRYSKEQIQDWENVTYGNCEIYNFEGGHFFINEKTEEIVSIINNALSKEGNL